MRETNLSIWSAVSKPPAEALKAIAAGRLKGKTDINPQWRMKAMTEQFGPVGIGWWYTIDSFDKHDLAGEVALQARVTLYVKGHEHGIPGVGGNMLVASEKSGMHLNDEAWKMAVTDALSVAMKALGIGADVYMGQWDGEKYKNDTSAADKWIEKIDSAADGTRGDVWKAAQKALKDANDLDSYNIVKAHVQSLQKQAAEAKKGNGGAHP